MKLNILTGKISWFGKESGYDVLTDYISSGNEINTIQSGDTLSGKIIGKLFQRLFKWYWVNTQDIYTELKFLFAINSKSVSHILHIESHVQIVDKIKKNRETLIGTIHLPIAQWQKKWLTSLQEIKHAIILYEKEVEAFQNLLPATKIYFIRHGVNIDFFKPLINRPVNNNKILIVGHYLRNFEMLSEVYKKLLIEFGGNLEFHIIIPINYRNTPALNKMQADENVFFYEKLSDQELLEHYQTSHLLLIPMNDSGANSAIVQALSVGLPVVTTDVGGIRSYGGGSVFPVVENNDVNEMVKLFGKFYHDQAFHKLISKNIRQFAVEHLDWKKIASQHVDVYNKILN